MKARIPKIVGVAAHSGKPESRDHVFELLALLEESKLTVLLEPEAAALVSTPKNSWPLKEIGKKADLVIVFGGDGTILRVARELEGAATPILGVNMGGLGFLTSVRAERLGEAVREVLQGEYQISERQMLQAGLLRDGQRTETHHALNDVVISRGTISRVVRLHLSIDGEMLTEYVCDGMIFATATGSTAYSLSAGGPILVPTAQALILTPICPHALSNRSVIAGESSAIRCQVASAAGELLLTVDGQVQLRLLVGDEVEVRRSPRTVQLASPRGHTYFGILREKLKWSGANV
jgi:NAD+ kinase